MFLETRSQDPKVAPLLKKTHGKPPTAGNPPRWGLFFNTWFLGEGKKLQIKSNKTRFVPRNFWISISGLYALDRLKTTNWSIIRAKRKHWLIRKCHKRILKRLQIVGSSNVQQICGFAYLPLVSWLPSNCSSCDTTTPKTTKASGEVLVQYPTPINHKTEGFADGCEPPKKNILAQFLAWK